MVPSSRINFLSLINFIWILSSCTSCSGHISKSTQARKWITGVAVSEGRGSGKTETSVSPLFYSVQLLIHDQVFASPWTVACQASLSITISWSLFKLLSVESVMPSNHLTLCCPLLLLPSIFPSIRVLSNESVLVIRWPKYWSFCFSPANELSGFPSGLTGLILQSKELSRVFSDTTVQKSQLINAQYSLWSNSILDYWKNHCFN